MMLPGNLRPLPTREGWAWVFGREDKGLETAELDLCQRFVTIPTDDACPSMNLAQSVSICLYETARIRAVTSGKNHRKQKDLFH